MAAKIKHVFGNVMKIAVPLNQKTVELIEGEISIITDKFYPFPPIDIFLYKGGGLGKHYVASISDNVVTFSDDGTLPVGLYQIEIVCKNDKNEKCRFMMREAVQIVDATADAGIEAGVEFNSETYTLEGATYYFAKGEDAKVNGHNTVEIVGDIVSQEGTTLTLDAYNKQQVDDKVNEIRPTISPDMDIYQEYVDLYSEPENEGVNF